MAVISAGILLYRITNKNILEVFLTHPGGPLFAKKDKGWWMIPKGLPNNNENLEDAAVREFFEETGIKLSGKLIALGEIKQKGGKIVHAWAVEGNVPDNFKINSNTFTLQWPPKSGKMVEFAEIDKAEFFAIEKAMEYILPSQIVFIERLMAYLKL